MGQQAGDGYHDVVRRTAIRYPRTGDRRSGAAEFVKENASACVTACFNELVPNVEDACRQLQQPEHQQTSLWNLYCCDSISCGVYIGGIGQSPNVDLIINECQNIGFFSIEDPGPPATNYCALSTSDTAAPHITINEPPILPTLRTWSTDSIEPDTAPPTGTLDTSMPFTSTSTLTGSTSSTSSAASTNAASSRLTEGAKVAISIFSVIAVLAIAAVLLLLVRRRKRSPRSSSPRPRLITFVNRPYPIPNSDSGTPLITPPPSASSRSALPPLTPPAKLSERRYLEPALNTGTPRPPASPSVANQTFLLSPVGVPTQSGHIPRHDLNDPPNNVRSPAIRGASVPPQHPQSSVYSLSSGPDGSTFTVESNKVSSVHSGSATVTGTSTPPLSATRFPRTHEGPLESSDFVTPSGPPPSRALPAPPPNHPNSPTFSVSSVSPRSPTFPARCLARGDSPIVPTQQGNTSRPPTSISAKELRDLTESYERETRESWGSWSGVGGGGPGVTSAGRKRGSVEKKGETKTGVPLQELDLEKLSGRY
ncbi:hypothetical protein F4782DRAFT_455144 [Xylaria castorea]|nr:hypothetical protein F4782DRAFT_455144 [Xylaria castorea]